jgi:hypothetical protein
MQHTQGFMKFLSVTEPDRYEFHENPRNSPEYFMEYLPFAIALGIEEDWSKIFTGDNAIHPGQYNKPDTNSLAITKSILQLSDMFIATQKPVTNKNKSH